MNKEAFESLVLQVASANDILTKVLEDLIKEITPETPPFDPDPPKQHADMAKISHPTATTYPKEIDQEDCITTTQDDYFHPFITALLLGEPYTDPITVNELKELKKYAFIEVHSSDERGVVFTFLGAINKKICVQKYTSYNVRNFMSEKGPGYYIIFSPSAGNPSYWTMAYKLANEKRAYILTKKFGKEYATAKLNGIDVRFKSEGNPKQKKVLAKKIPGKQVIEDAIKNMKSKK